MQQPEQQARTEIDQLLTAAGWRLQDRNVFDRNVALGVAVRASAPILSEIKTIAQAPNVLGAHFNATRSTCRRTMASASRDRSKSDVMPWFAPTTVAR